MTNLERYKNEIVNFKPEPYKSFCSRFIEPKVLNSMGKKCNGLHCSQCAVLILLWLVDEYKEPEVDWSKVPVDTRIYVRDYEEDDWCPAYFAKFEEGTIYAWASARTSWTAKGCVATWKYAKLAEEDEAARVVSNLFAQRK